MDIDTILQWFELRRTSNFCYTVGDCLFDAISYCMEHEYSGNELRSIAIKHLQTLMTNIDEYEQSVLYAQFTEDVLLEEHNVHDIYEYIAKMSISAKDGGLWGDHRMLYLISEALHIYFNIWGYNEERIICTFGEMYNLHNPIHLLYDNRIDHVQHYEPLRNLQTNINESTTTLIQLSNIESPLLKTSVLDVEDNSDQMPTIIIEDEEKKILAFVEAHVHLSITKLASEYLRENKLEKKT